MIEPSLNNLTTLGLSAALAMMGYMIVWFLVATIAKRNDLADTAWGLGFIYLSGFFLLQNTEPGPIAWTAFGLTAVWGLRLATHVYLRNRGKPEDFRYAAWRKQWGKYFLIRSFLQVYMLQGLFLILVASPVILSAKYGNAIDVSAWFLAGLLTWATGIYFEAIGDWQLTKFIQQKKSGKLAKSKQSAIMDKGLWKYSRHPNYFGEVTQWWGLWIVLVSSNLPGIYKLVGLAGPISITYLILFVSGVPMLEKKYAKDKAYQAYARKTNKFFPWSPKQ